VYLDGNLKNTLKRHLSKGAVKNMTAEVTFSETQKQRLLELGASQETLALRFISEPNRNDYFNQLAGSLSVKNAEILDQLRTTVRRPALTRISAKIADILITDGFVEVATPAFLARGLLKKMNLAENDDLWKQVFWVDKNRCLRPMLAPNLYFLLGHLQRLWPRPIRLFEIGSCWRKESKGSRHLEEFTMLNLVELGCPYDPLKRLTEVAELVMDVIGLSYDLKEEPSHVYGATLDVVSGGVEVASGATGPHPLDQNWNISESWAGLGVGLERVCMLATDSGNVQRVGRSLIYLNGARLNI
jgi:phenylalanyl-tRNA synthetase alpha chain